MISICKKFRKYIRFKKQRTRRKTSRIKRKIWKHQRTNGAIDQLTHDEVGQRDEEIRPKAAPSSNQPKDPTSKILNYIVVLKMPERDEEIRQKTAPMS